MYERLATGEYSELRSHTLMTSWPGVSSNRGIGSIMTGMEGESGDQWITDHKGQLMGPGAHIKSVIVNLRASVRASVSPI